MTKQSRRPSPDSHPFPGGVERHVRPLHTIPMRGYVAPILLFLAAGCAGSLRPAGRLWREGTPTVEALVAPLRREAVPIETLWLRGRVTLRRRYLPGRLHCDVTVLAEPPDRLRLRAYRNVTIRVMDVLADARGVRIYDALENRYFAGGSEALPVSGLPWVDLAKALLQDGLLVEQAVLRRVDSATRAQVRRRWKTWEMRLEHAGECCLVRFDRATGRIVALSRTPARGGVAARLQYGDFLEVGGVQLPRRVELEYGRARVRLDVFDDPAPKINVPGGFDPRVFQLEPPPGQRWLPLE